MTRLFLQMFPAGLVLAGLLITAPACAQLTIELTVPASTPLDATVHVAGTFNGWNPGDSAYALTDQGGGLWTITFPGNVRGAIQFCSRCSGFAVFA